MMAFETFVGIGIAVIIALLIEARRYLKEILSLINNQESYGQIFRTVFESANLLDSWLWVIVLIQLVGEFIMKFFANCIYFAIACIFVWSLS